MKRADWQPEVEHEPEPVRAPPAESGTIRYLAVRGVLDLLEMVAARNGVSIAELLSKRRTGPISKARADAIRELRALGHSRSEVARMLGLDHTTVIYHDRGGRKCKRSF